MLLIRKAYHGNNYDKGEYYLEKGNRIWWMIGSLHQHLKVLIHDFSALKLQ